MLLWVKLIFSFFFMLEWPFSKVWQHDKITMITYSLWKKKSFWIELMQLVYFTHDNIVTLNDYTHLQCLNVPKMPYHNFRAKSEQNFWHENSNALLYLHYCKMIFLNDFQTMWVLRESWFFLADPTLSTPDFANLRADEAIAGRPPRRNVRVIGNKISLSYLTHKCAYTIDFT